MYASRFPVTAEVLGHGIDRLHLLDGDYAAWQHDHPVSTETRSPQGTNYACEWTDGEPLFGADQLEDEHDPGAVIVDMRDPL